MTPVFFGAHTEANMDLTLLLKRSDGTPLCEVTTDEAIELRDLLNSVYPPAKPEFRPLPIVDLPAPRVPPMSAADQQS